jgi:VWFA-related protein
MAASVALRFSAAILFLAAASAGLPAAAQTPAPDEMTTRETVPNYKLEVERNLVLVRAVVRDAKGLTVRNLHKEDFRIFDNGKLQTITNFSEEAPSTAPVPGGTAEKAEPLEVRPESELSPSAPRRYLGLYLDDIHMSFEEIARIRGAADHYLAQVLTPGDRVGLFTASGQDDLDFTDDREGLREALLRVRPRPLFQKALHSCPEIFDYQAYLIVHEKNPYAIEIATEEALQCHFRNDSKFIDMARGEIEADAERELERYERDTETSLRGLDQVIRRMAILPGQRSIVLISPGFLTVSLESHVNKLVDEALRDKIIINSLDSKGLAAFVPFGDASEERIVIADRTDLMGRKTQIELNAQTLSADVLRNLAGDTGGVYFHNDNDLEKGFQRVGALPEVYYTLAFSPQKMKFDGRFHTLKVTLVNAPSLAVEARRGYFAPAQPQDAEAQAKEEIMQAVFTQDQLSGIPLEVHTQFFKRRGADASLSVLAHVDLRFLPFRKADGRNLNGLTVVTALFDRDGNYLAGKEKRVDFKLLDTSLEKLAQSGLTMRTRFDVKPGTYLIREVVRSSEGARISGLTRTVEIPD